ncbi:Uncharacterised protein [Nocardia africana]|uniref:TY-Chap N-terminal domain-containing protein n=2 Tax=Nocardia africana TaxID=134964 RepID=A0A378WUZ0_9NOCA|nr:Uncharacterised protein [Nocardia africana]
MLSYSANSVTPVVNAYYHMQLSVRLTAEMTETEIAELRWYLGLGSQPPRYVDLADSVDLVPRFRAHHPDSPVLFVDLTALDDGGWLLSAWQEPAPEDVDRLEPLFVWLASHADATEITPEGWVYLGHLRFYDEPEWTYRITVYRNRVFYARPDRRRPARELIPNGEAMVSTWNDFAARLALTLRHWREGEWMTLVAPEGGYAQFTITDDGEVYGEISSNNSLDEDHRMTPAAEAAMRQLGWLEPDQMFGSMNWFWELPTSATDDQYRSLAYATVSALRDVLGITDPQQLSLTAESHFVGEVADVSAMGIKLGVG